MYVEADMSLQFAITLAAIPSNPTFKTTSEPESSKSYENKLNAIISFGLRVEPF